MFSKKFVEPIAIILILITAYLDYSTGDEYTLGVLYLVPILIIAWNRKGVLPYIVALLSSITEAAIKSLFELSYHPTFAYNWNIILNALTFVFVTFLILKIKKLYENEKELARVDFLTGILNTKGFTEVLEIEINRAKRLNLPLSVAYIDLDNFKELNDELGHKEGDKALKIVGQTIVNNIRKTDFTARLGGDEFAVILTSASPENAFKLINKIQELLLYKMDKNKYPVTFSIGLVTFITPPDTTDEILKTADLTMYQVKSGTKNSIKQEVFIDNKGLELI